jgi:hypothetical protein
MEPFTPVKGYHCVGALYINHPELSAAALFEFERRSRSQ